MYYVKRCVGFPEILGLSIRSYIVGKAIWVWKSEDKYTGKLNWGRFFKRIN